MSCIWETRLEEEEPERTGEAGHKDTRQTGRGGSPKALQPESQGKLAGLVLFSIHHGRDHLGVLHNDCHLTVSLSQHASVVDVGRAYRRNSEKLLAALPLGPTLLRKP